MGPKLPHALPEQLCFLLMDCLTPFKLVKYQGSLSKAPLLTWNLSPLEIFFCVSLQRNHDFVGLLLRKFPSLSDFSDALIFLLPRLPLFASSAFCSYASPTNESYKVGKLSEKVIDNYVITLFLGSKHFLRKVRLQLVITQPVLEFGIAT